RDKRGDTPLRLRLNGLLSIFGALEIATRIGQPEWAAVAVRVRNVMDAGNRRGRNSPRGIAGEAQSHIRAAAVAVAQRNHVLTLGVELSNQDRCLIRFGAAIGEERFLQPSR